MKVYTASVLRHAPMWLGLRNIWAPEIELISRWLDTPDIENGDANTSAQLCAKGWVENLEDIRAADALICYGDPDDSLRGALIEAGMAIALHTPVLCVGSNIGFGSWKFHPLCYRLASLVGAKGKLEYWRTGGALRAE